ncbi:VCBS domain-containing protein [Bradyrhizobium sp. WSM 1704]|uniref:VCBS domain-containing protein n=1 Tax=Bradyrhizobium semiaridum TaxID=2821404 RepID=UPI001CE385F7|nr:VCBS domain-containing protein [Bradyrhizobium semiaridum]MCA6123305.1 VCBS domain-containing protein [Bradyrhizobium semiaridum]
MNFVEKFDGFLPKLDAHSHGSVHVDSVSAHAPPGAIVVEDGKFLFTADFKRAGLDLVLSKDDRELVLHDYFKGEKRAALASPDGAHLTGDLVNALTGYTQYAQAGGAPDSAKVIGHVTKLIGNATAIRNGVAIVLNQGDNVNKGDVVQSGSDSTLGITFIDGTVFGLGPNAKMVLNEMVYDPNGSSNSALLSLVQGTISFVAGATAKHGDMKVDTPVATMGIRGTAVLVEIDFDVQGTGGVPPAKFQVLVEPDGTTGSYILFDKTTLNPIATVDRAGTQTVVNGQGSVSFISSANLSADAQKLISDVFALKFTDNNNPNTKLTTNFTDSVVPITTTFKLASGDVVTQTLLLRILPDGSDHGGHAGGSLADHIPGPPAVATFNESFTERAGVTHSGLLDTVVNQIKWLDVNEGDRPSATVTFADFTYHDAASNDVTSSLTAAQIAAIKAVEAPLLLVHAPDNTNVGSATWTYSLADGAFDFLAAGETLVLTYTARVDNNFAPSNETTFKDFTITITGTDDTPVVTSAAQTAAITEIPDAMHSAVPDRVSGTLTFTDADLTDTHTVTIIGVAASGVTSGLADHATVLNWLSLGTLTDSTDGVTGSRNWTFAATDRNFDYLAAGETLTLTYTVEIDDHQGGLVTLPVTITVTGTNDTPVVTSPAQRAAITEAAGATGSQQLDAASGTVSFVDLDLSDTHRVTIASVTGSGVTSGLADQATVLSWLSLGTLTDSTGGVTGSRDWTFTAADRNFDYLAAGEKLTLTYQIQIDDQQGGVVTVPVTITVTGTNDKPVITSAPQTAAITEIDGTTGSAQPDTASGIVTFADADRSDTHSLTITGVTEQGATAGLADHATVLSWLSLGTLTDSTGGVTGSRAWTFTAADHNFDYLAVGETLTLTYTVQLADNHGAVTTEPITITINGSNDAPTLADVNAGSLTDTAAKDSFGSITGLLQGHDVDDGETATLTYAALDAGDHPVNTAVTGLYGSLTVNADGSYTYVPDAAAIDALTAGNYADTFTVETIDAHGAHGTATLTINVTGVNDAPVTTDDVVSIPGNTGSAAGSLLANDSDAEHNALSISGVGNEVATSGQFTVEGIYGELVVDPLTGTYTYTLGVTAAQAAAVAALPGGVNGVEQFTYQAFDGALGTYGHLVVKVEGINDAPIFTGNDLAVTYMPGSSAVALVDGVAAQDVDNVVFDGGSLTVAVTSGGHAGDTLTIVGNDHIFLDADNNVLFDADGVGGEGAVLIGTMTSGLDNLTVDFNANADPAAVAALAQAIEFENADTAAEGGTRTVTFTLRDGSGAANDSSSFTASVDVDGNHPATITGDISGVVYEDDHVVIPSGQTIANDVDSGTLSVQDVDPNQDYFLPVDQSALTGFYGDFTFDPDSGHWTYALVHDRVDQLAAGQIAYDTLTVTTADGTTQAITIEVNGTNDAPVVTANDLLLTYVPHGDAVAIVDTVSVSDIDSSDFDGGSLTATITDGRHDGDLLTITADDFISVSGTTVMFDADGDGSAPAVAIGTLSDSVDPAIDLNDKATSDAIAHLIQAIHFQSIDGNPVGGQRTVEFTLNDGDGIDHNGHDSGTLYATVDVDQAPLIVTNNLQIFEEGQTITIGGLSVSDPDAGSTEFFTFDAESTAGFVTPSNETGSVDDISGTLNSGLTYAPGPDVPLSDKITLTVKDGLGATDIVNLIFNVAGEGNVSLQGTGGKDVIIATGYSDTLTGGAGADQFVFRAGTGSDTITDFTPGQDKIDLLDSMPFTSGDTESFNAWISDNTAVEQVGNDTLIHLDIGDSIRLSNVSRSSLHANDFILHPGVIT